MTDKNIKGIEDIPGAIKIWDGREQHPIETIPGAIRVQRVPKKPTEDELREKLANEARERQKNRTFIPPKHSSIA